MSKYNSKKVEVDGILFDSKKEAKRWTELKAMEERGEITNLERQVRFELIPNQKIDGKVVERAMHYVADFVYIKDGEKVVEDVKGFKRGDAYVRYSYKRKLMLWRFGLRIKEV